MQQWTQVQASLAEQLSQARYFVTQYQRFSETRKFSEKMQSMIDGLDKEISGQIDKLEQTVRDLLQIVRFPSWQLMSVRLILVGICVGVNQ